MDNCWVINISEGDDKQVKTQASSRIVPIHHHLITLGLVEYKDKLRRPQHMRVSKHYS